MNALIETQEVWRVESNTKRQNLMTITTFRFMILYKFRNLKKLLYCNAQILHKNNINLHA